MLERWYSVWTSSNNTFNGVSLKGDYTLQGSGYAENVTYHYTENEITCGVGNKIDYGFPGGFTVMAAPDLWIKNVSVAGK